MNGHLEFYYFLLFSCVYELFFAANMFLLHNTSHLKQQTHFDTRNQLEELLLEIGHGVFANILL